MRFQMIVAAGLWVSLIFIAPVFGQDRAPASKESMRKSLEEFQKHRLEILGQIREMGMLEKVDVNRAYLAASGAFMIGAPQEGILPMERAMKDDPDGKVPGLNVPFSVTGHFVLGAMAKYSGDWERACAEYLFAIEATHAVEERDKIKPGLSAVAMLYLAEAQEKLGKREEAMATLEAIEKLPEQKSISGALPVDPFKEWARWKLEILKTGKAVECERQLKLNKDSSFMLFMLLPMLSGVENTMASYSVGGIDFECAILVAGMAITQEGGRLPAKEDYEKAKMFFLQGLNHGGYLSIQHGLAALSCMKELNQDDEAKALQGKLLERYPGLKEEILAIYPGRKARNDQP